MASAFRFFPFFLCIPVVVALAGSGCGGGDAADAGGGAGMDAGIPDIGPTDAGTSDAGTADAGYPARREQRGKFIVAWIGGTPYEMGFQHGTLLHEELKAGMEYIESDPLLSNMYQMAADLGIIPIARENTYPDILEECKGLSAAAKDVGWTVDKCLVLNFGDVVMEYIMDGMPTFKTPGCSEVAVAGGATAKPGTPTDAGRLLHGRILDWSKIQFILDYPTIFVREPSDGIAHAYIGFPANLSPYSGINAEGVSIASNEIHPKNDKETALSGHSHVQMLGQLLKKAHSLDEARTIIQDETHMSSELFMVADGKARTASVFEMTAAHLGERRMNEDGVVWATNHFLAPETEAYDMDPTREANTLRYERFRQLVDKDATDWTGARSTQYGAFNPLVLVEVLRDRYNPYTGEQSAYDEFDNGKSIATYGALFAIVFQPEDLWFWVAAGTIPVPQQEYTGFSLGELLRLPGAQAVNPTSYPAAQQ